jgi:carbon-monoxide dehydrogenase large subunit
MDRKRPSPEPPRGIVLNGIGQPVPRKEDRRLLCGQGRFTDDLTLPDQAYAVMVRSPHAHARILSIDPGSALRAPGVLAVLTGADARSDGLNAIPHNPLLPGLPDIPPRLRPGTVPFISPHFPLPDDKVRFNGEAVVIVVAETLLAAQDAAERVEIRYQPLAAVTQATAGAAPNSIRLFDAASSNVALEGELGDADATAQAFAKAAHVVRLSTWVQRVTGVPMDLRAALASYDRATGCYVLYAGSGNVVRQRRELAGCLGVSEDKVRVIAYDIGGNFGTRNPFYPEVALVAWTARRLGRPVKWTCERQEAMLSDYQARDLTVAAELALDQKGNFLAIRSSNMSNLGAQTVIFAPLAKGVELMTGIYRIPAAHVEACSVLTNTPPTNSYRSSGRPEAMFVVERLIDLAAHEHGFDRIALRRRNLIPEGAMPYTNALGLSYDNGAYRNAMDSALRLADWHDFGQRRREARRRGRRRGLGIANYIEIASGAPRERVEITIKPEGVVEVVIGTLASGQGHETSFAQLITEWLGVPFEAVRLVTGDTERVEVGGGSHAGRSMRMASIVIGKATDAIMARASQIAGHLLNAGDRATVFADGRFSVAGSARSVGLFEIAAAARDDQDLPSNLRGTLAAICDDVIKTGAFPYGCHICEVEVDPDTGQVDIVRYAAVDDVGRAVNPLIVHGQTHGGIVQGIGQALLERCCYDPDNGQLLSGSFMDYAMPRASDVPTFVTEISEVPSPSNRVGIRAGGEGGTTPALAAVINAIVDALVEFGVRHIEMPATPERVWRTIRSARAGTRA